MQKKLIALAVAGLASTAAFAQSNVTIYGVLQPSYDMMSQNNGAPDFNEMSWNNTRIGFKGEEALGNGLKAIFQIESKVSITQRGEDGGDPESLLASRDSWVGLAGGFGSITFGNHQSAYVRTSASYDPFADTIGDYNNIMGLMFDVTAPEADDFFNKRRNRSIYYTSPNMSGVVFTYSHAMNEVDVDGAPSFKTDSF